MSDTRVATRPYRIHTETGGFLVSASSAAPYVGPGDVAAFKFWWGLRSYSFATLGATVVTLRRYSDNTTQSFASLSSGGLDVSAITTFAGGSTLSVNQLWDQFAGGLHLVPNSSSTEPIFTFNGFNTKPAMTFTAANSQCLISGPEATTTLQPYSYWAVFNYTAAGGSFIAYDNGAGSVPTLGPSPAIGNLVLHSNTDLLAAGSSNTWHTDLAVANGVVSQHYIDAVGAGAGDAGSIGCSTSGGFNYGGSGFLGFLNGKMVEAGILAAEASTSASGLNSNATGFYI